MLTFVAWLYGLPTPSLLRPTRALLFLPRSAEVCLAATHLFCPYELPILHGHPPLGKRRGSGLLD